VRGTAFLIQFLRVVPPVPVLMNGAFVASAAAAAVALGLHATDPRGALAPVFLLQTLAASSGFAVPARRGHYDLLLTCGVSRLRIGVAHFVASILPGVLCWLVIVALEAVSDGRFPQVTLGSGTIAALVIVSALSWSATVPLPRLTGGIVWLLVFVAPVNHDLFPATASMLALPWTLVGTDVFAFGVIPVVSAAAVVASAVTCALVWICRTDVSLQVAR
jgi:hypothetical protein